MRWHKVQYACREAGCPRTAFTEQIPEVPARARVTGRLRRHVARLVADGAAVSTACAELMSWPVAHRAWVAHAEARLAEPSPVRVLGIDETRRGRPTWRQDPDTGKWLAERFETNFVDLAGTQGLLGQTAGRTKSTVLSWLNARGAGWKNAVEIVAMDPCAPYRAAIRQALPHAMIVADHFHLVRLANQAVTEVRRRVSWDAYGRRGRQTDPRGQPAAGCCAPGSGSPTDSSPGCGTTWSTASPPGRSWPAGSLRKSYARCSPRRAPAGSGTTSPTGCTASSPGAPAPTCRSSSGSP